MDSSSSTTASTGRVLRADSSNNSSSGKALRSGEKEKPDDKSKMPSHRSTRYKEKFQALREEYDRVTAQHNEYERALDNANARIKQLQAENDLLLDAMYIALPTQPTLMKALQYPADSNHLLSPIGGISRVSAPPNSSPRAGHFSPHVTHANGHVNGSANGDLHRRMSHDGHSSEFVMRDKNGQNS